MNANIQNGIKETGVCDHCEEKLISIWSNSYGWIPERHRCKGPSAQKIREIFREEIRKFWYGEK